MSLDGVAAPQSSAVGLEEVSYAVFRIITFNNLYVSNPIENAASCINFILCSLGTNGLRTCNQLLLLRYPKPILYGKTRICLRMYVETHDKSNFELRGSNTNSLFDDLIVILVVNACPYLCIEQDILINEFVVIISNRVY